MDAARKHILEKYRIPPDARLSGGMEAEVYAYGPDAVVKLYAGTATFADLTTLRDFYDSLNRALLPYDVPRIHSVAQEGQFTVTIEQRLAGTRLSAALRALAPAQLDAIMQRYLSAALALSRVGAPAALERYKLYDPYRLSWRAGGDWHQFLSRYLTHQLAETGPYLNRDVAQFAARVKQLRAVLDQPYQGDYRLIHGDFFPGNLLVNEQHEIAALLDFGLLTMYGDHLFDLATGWVFFDMYDELKAQIRDRYLAMLLERIGAGLRGKLYRYVLIYSILSANNYSPDCTDGHYRWCVANLSDCHHWDAIE